MLPNQEGRGTEKGKDEEHRFVIEVEDDQELFNFLTPLKGYIRFTPLEFQLGSASLPGILEEVELFVTVTGQEACFGATLFGRDSGNNLPIPYSLEHLSRRLRFTGLTVKTWLRPESMNQTTRFYDILGNSQFVVTDSCDDSGSDLVINDPSLLLSSGWQENRITNFGQFRKTVASFTRVVQALVEAVYLEANEKVPKAKLILHKEPTEGNVLLATLGSGERRGLSEVGIPTVSFAEIGGQEAAVSKMREIALALRHPESFKRWGSHLPKGVLLVGPPGNGKTLMGKAMAHEAQAHFIPVNISDILICWVGTSERKVTAIFDAAKTREGKTILFFDELDALGRSRAKTINEYSASLLLTINQNIDGISGNPNVIVIGTTNRKGDIDPALLREGRFDLLVEVPLPDAKGRAEILAIQMVQAEQEAGMKIFDQIDLGLLSQRTNGASGARLAEIIRRATWHRGVQEANATAENRQIAFPLISDGEILEVIAGYEKR